jgi:hypothetical protein
MPIEIPTQEPLVERIDLDTTNCKQIDEVIDATIRKTVFGALIGVDPENTAELASACAVAYIAITGIATLYAMHQLTHMPTSDENSKLTHALLQQFLTMHKVMMEEGRRLHAIRVAAEAADSKH